MWNTLGLKWLTYASNFVPSQNLTKTTRKAGLKKFFFFGFGFGFLKAKTFKEKRRGEERTAREFGKLRGGWMSNNRLSEPQKTKSQTSHEKSRKLKKRVRLSWQMQIVAI